MPIGNNGNGSKLLFWILGLSIAILFAAVGLLVQDVRGDIEENRRAINGLERQILKLEGVLQEEQRLTEQIRQWHFPRLTRIEELVHQLESTIRQRGMKEEGR